MAGADAGAAVAKARRKLLKVTARLAAPGLGAAERARLTLKMQAYLARVDQQTAALSSPAPLAGPSPHRFAPSPRTGGGIVAPPPTAEELARRAVRAQRFEQGAAATPSAPKITLRQARATGRAEAYGSSTALEKEYLRITALPTVDAVRPPAVLAAALARVKGRWLEAPDYAHACEQLKSIRQDLTVQAVRGRLAVDAYETHARVALEAGDLAEFNQCQTALSGLYAEAESGGVEGGGASGARPRIRTPSTTPSNPPAALRNVPEFDAYRLLYAQAVGAGGLGAALRGLAIARGPAGLAHPFVAHALAVCHAARAGDARAVVAAYGDAPRMAPYLMDRLLPAARRVRARALVRAHAPGLPLAAAAAALGTEDEGEAAGLVAEAGARVEAGEVVTRERATGAGRVASAPAEGPKKRKRHKKH